MKDVRLTDFLPTTKKELELRGWDYVDVILFSGDAYVDHPSFAAAVIGRTLQAQGLRVAIVPQPDWRGDFRDFTKLGRPRLFFAISAGCMDSMVNHYTANRRRRSDDAYTPDGRPGMRPDYCTITYAQIIKRIYPDVPLVIGGIEASMRRLTHYDYWADRLMPSILVDSKADLLIYGMGEKPITALAKAMITDGQLPFNIPQTVYLSDTKPMHCCELHAHETCLRDKRAQAENFRHIEEQSNSMQADTLVQQVGDKYVVVNPPFPPMTTEEIDASFDLPYTRLPHPKYKGKTIPAYEMIRFSVNLHRGCFGGCAFCTISAHQGKHIASRSKQSVLKEIGQIAQLPGFKGYLSDLGGPSANMYAMHGKDVALCARCKRPSCIQPTHCKNLNVDFEPLLDIYRSVDALPYIKKAFVSSGVRYDLLSDEYAQCLIRHHVSGRLKVAPEHTSPQVLRLMRKPSFECFDKFRKFFEQVNREAGINQQLIPYFISSHPGCTVEDMAQLAILTKQMNFQLEQVQDFTPTPMTLSTEMYYTGLNPYTMEPVYVARSKEDKLAQRQFFFWYKPEYRQTIKRTLEKIHRADLVQKLLQPYRHNMVRK
ncbi:MAG: YgiQ family radical SAM protein [Paludibacter sp.]|nr:YgiQ family radical SAM protein [Bacteroidales bacterium]MCM1069124.1 YgiQ family radical SAM protein [Prevotella sp.]MCM1353563.1 YgiQ family radical SAM protein [Bacteroides sp.]MCM1442724.1 YgiQ family radical SAM protein [Muribaculum sp.]MCM1481640.1 YgiQ family radical SAM protein [Paludibacter sp.]